MTPSPSESTRSSSAELAKRALVAGVALGGIGAALLLAELALRTLAPLANATIGSVYSANGARYGWGFEPNEKLVLHEPDSGEIIASRVNAQGWRDREHALPRPPGTFRILVVGDSHTFAPLVRDASMSGRVLEERLLSEGFGVEVITIASPGWGTDQELEALRLEGVAYQPDLVVFQFCVNDLDDNDYYHEAGSHAWYPKPFYYRLDDSGRLERNANPEFEAQRGSALRRAFWRVLRRSEIARRIHGLVRHVPPGNEDPHKASYRADAATFEQLEVVLGLAPDAAFLERLRARSGKPLDKVEVEALITRYGLERRREDVLRILELRWFDNLWSKKVWALVRSDPKEYRWRLYFALMREARRVASESGAALAILSDHDEGARRWMVRWRLLPDGPEGARSFLEPTRLVQDFARDEGIGFVALEHPQERARNDPHGNAKGNLATAENLYGYLMRHHRDALEATRRTAASAPPPARRDVVAP